MKHQASSWGGPAHNQAPDFFQEKKIKKQQASSIKLGGPARFQAPTRHLVYILPPSPATCQVYKIL